MAGSRVPSLGAPRSRGHRTSLPPSDPRCLLPDLVSGAAQCYGDSGNNSLDSLIHRRMCLYPHAARSAAGVRAQAKQATKEEKDGSSAARQMLGMKGASDETNIWKIRVQLTKPVTWIPLIWGES